MALRTIPAMLGYARLIEEVAPDALLVNFTNPVGIVMQALHDQAPVRASASATARLDAAERGGASSASPPRTGPRRLLRAEPLRVDPPRAGRRARPPARAARPLRRAPARRRTVAAVRPGARAAIGMLPMEYLYFYYYRDEAVRTSCGSGSSRGAQLQALNDALWPDPALVRSTRVTSRGRRGVGAGDGDARRDLLRAGARRGGRRATTARPATPSRVEGYEGMATAVMVAAVQRRKVPLILNVPNRGAIHGLLDDDVVEVTCLVDEHGAHPIAQGDCPRRPWRSCARSRLYERLTVTRRRGGLVRRRARGAAAHPLVGSYSPASDPGRLPRRTRGAAPGAALIRADDYLRTFTVSLVSALQLVVRPTRA